MIRALYTAASGMNAQQVNIDNVAHNLANVNTVGFKKSRVEFEDLVYQQSKAPGSPTSSTGEAPVGLEMGLGVRSVASARDFGRGNMRATSSPLDMAVEGDGLFQVTLPSGEAAYSRSGTFHLSAEGSLVTSEGYPMQPQITVPAGTTSITISKGGFVSATISCQTASQEIGTIELASFRNSAGLRSLGGNLFQATTASGDPTVGVPGVDGRGTVAQGYLEDSNVSVVEEMVTMILSQRAYEANSKVVKASDEMLQQVNSLVR
jgi:flagellar basal-body rod protein FlgG